MKKIFTLLFAALSINSFSQSTTVVISQVYGGGGATGGTPTYQYDYVELHNISLLPQNIGNFSIQYGSATGNYASVATNLYVIPANTIILPGQYLLFQFGVAGTGSPLPVTADFISGNITASASGGKFALSNKPTALGCGSSVTPSLCAANNPDIVDQVAYGNVEQNETAPAEALTNTSGLVRKLAGCQDTNNNSADFEAVTNPVPRNGSLLNISICNAITPLSLTSFNASYNGKSADLKWTTVDESNVKGFSIERSSNGSAYSEVGFVKANNGQRNQYSFNDANVKSGTNFYRLKSVNNDGSFKYSEVHTISSKSGIKASLFPNPTFGSLTVSHSKAALGAIINVLSVEGKQVKTFKVQSGALQTSVSVNELVKGNYLLVYENDGEKSVTKFTKQ